MLDAVLGEVRPGRAVLLDRAGRADVVGGDRVAELEQHPGALDVGDRLGLVGHAVEVRRLADVRRVLVPGEGVALGSRQRLPLLVSGEHVGVVVGEHLRRDRLADHPLDLAERGPEVLEKDVVPVLVLPERVTEEVDVHRAGQRVGDDQRRGREVVHLHVGVDPALEVAVAGQHAHDGEVLLVDRGAHLGDEGSGVADARRTAVADEVEAELVEVRREAGLLVVVADHLGTRRQRRLDPRLALQSLLHGVLGEQRGRDHHARVGRVGARRDRGDHDGAVVDHGLLAVEGHGHRVARAAAVLRGRRRPARGAVPVGVAGRVRGGEGLGDRLVVPLLLTGSPST